MDVTALEGGADGGAQNAILVRFCGGVEAGVEVFGGLHGREDADIAGEKAIHRFFEIQSGDGIFQRERCYLRERVDSGVGAA